MIWGKESEVGVLPNSKAASRDLPMEGEQRRKKKKELPKDEAARRERQISIETTLDKCRDKSKIELAFVSTVPNWFPHAHAYLRQYNTRWHVQRRLQGRLSSQLSDGLGDTFLIGMFLGQGI